MLLAQLGTTQPARGHTGVEQARPRSRGYVRSKGRTQAQCKRFLSRSCSVQSTSCSRRARSFERRRIPPFAAISAHGTSVASASSGEPRVSALRQLPLLSIGQV